MWRMVGRQVDLNGREQWLQAPTSQAGPVGANWLAAAAEQVGGSLDEQSPGGLIADMARLDGPDFQANAVSPQIRDFYEQTSQWRMEVWTQWTPMFRPAGELVSRFFGRRVQQLALPTRPLDVALGMDSRVVRILDGQGEQVAAGWLRTLRSTGEYVYSGCYSVRRLPDHRQASIHVAFPLEAGNVQVFLRPTVQPDSSLRLSSPPGEFGEDGCYVVVTDHGDHAARAPIHEDFRVYVDGEGTLRTNHRLRFRSTTMLKLHYKLTRV